jgi:hypothetical protein
MGCVGGWWSYARRHILSAVLVGCLLGDVRLVWFGVDGNRSVAGVVVMLERPCGGYWYCGRYLQLSNNAITGSLPSVWDMPLLM